MLLSLKIFVSWHFNGHFITPVLPFGVTLWVSFRLLTWSSSLSFLSIFLLSIVVGYRLLGCCNRKLEIIELLEWLAPQVPILSDQLRLKECNFATLISWAHTIGHINWFIDPELVVLKFEFWIKKFFCFSPILLLLSTRCEAVQRAEKLIQHQIKPLLI